MYMCNCVYIFAGNERMDNTIELSNDVSQSKFWGSFQWAILSITLVIMTVFVIRPALFLRQGLVSNIAPNDYFVVVNDIFIIANIFGIFITAFYLIQQYRSLISSLIYYIIYAMIITTAIVNIVILSIYSSNCNTVDSPNNPCNSDEYCCKYGNSIPQCQPILSPAPICNIPISVLNNLKANAIFIEYFVWVGVLILFNGLTIFIFWSFVNSLNIEIGDEDNIESNNEERDDNKSTIDSNINMFSANHNDRPFRLPTMSMSSHYFPSSPSSINAGRQKSNTNIYTQQSHDKNNDPTLTELVHTLSKKAYSYSQNIASKLITTLDTKYKNYTNYKKRI